MIHEDPLYGPVEFTDLEEKFIDNPAVQRLKDIHQNGAAFLVNPDMDTTRFEHSLGTAFLCKKLGASEEEIISAITHDIPHTAFSHLADQVFERENQDYHEDHHSKFVEKFDLDELAGKIDLDPDFLFKPENFSILEKDSPDLCADRLDYTLRDLYHYGSIDRKDVKHILGNLRVENGVIAVENDMVGRKLIEMYVKLVTEVFADPKHEAAELIMKEILEESMEKGILKPEDLFKVDEHVLEKIKKDSKLRKKFRALKTGPEIEKGVDKGSYEYLRKFRHIDPIVAGTGMRTSQINREARKILRNHRNNFNTKARYKIILQN